MISVPARMKKGSASIGKDWVCANICCTTSSSGICPSQSSATPEAMTSACATGITATIRATKATIRARLMSASPRGSAAAWPPGRCSAMRIAVVTVPMASSTQPAAIAQ